MQLSSQAVDGFSGMVYQNFKQQCVMFNICIFFPASSVIRTESTQSFSDDKLEINSPTSSFSVISDEGKPQRNCNRHLLQ